MADCDLRITELTDSLHASMCDRDDIGALVAVASLVYYPLTDAQRARIRWTITPSTAGEPVS